LRDDKAENGPMSVFRRAKERQPEISERVVPVIAVLAKISPGIAELMKGVNLRYGLRGAESLEAAQAQFVPEDFLPSSSYTKSTQGAYATGCAVSREVSVAAAAQVEKEVIADDAAARNGAQPSHLRFTKSVKAKEGAAQFFVFPYSGIGTQGKSSIDQRFWEKFTNRSFISKWFRTCASIANEKEGGISAHMRVFNYAAVTKPIIVEMFLHAGKRAGYNTTLEMDHDIEALFGGAFLGGRLDDGGLNVGDLGSLVLGKGFDGKGRGPQAYAILDTAAVLEQIKREQVEERPAVAVFEDVSWGLNALRDLHQLMVKKNTTAEVLATRDAKKRGTTVPTLEQITAGEFARWLNAAGGLASAAERKRLHETDDSELTPVEKGKKRKWDGFGGNQQAHANAQAAVGVPLADRDVDPEKEAAWRRKLKDGAAAGGVPLADRDVDPEKEAAWRRKLKDGAAAGGVPLADRDVDPEKENQWRNATAAVGVPLADRDVDPEKEAAWRRKLKDGAAAGGVPLADRDVDPEKEAAWRRKLKDGAAAGGVPLADRDVDPEKENQWRNATAAGWRAARRPRRRPGEGEPVEERDGGGRRAARRPRRRPGEGGRVEAQAQRRFREPLTTMGEGPPEGVDPVPPDDVACGDGDAVRLQLLREERQRQRVFHPCASPDLRRASVQEAVSGWQGQAD
jgi:hypothetical protein